MKFKGNIFDTINSAIRYKLLVLVLFPILLVMPIALALAIVWGTDFTYKQLYNKVNTDLSVSHDIFKRIRKDYLNQLERLGESYIFRTALLASDQTQLVQLVSELRERENYSYLHLLNSAGQYVSPEKVLVDARSSSALLNAYRGNMSAGIEIFSASDLRNISDVLYQQALIELIETPRARPSIKTHENRGMMIRVLYPIKDTHDELMAILDGGILLNGNFGLVDTIRDLVYGEGSLPEGSIGTVTVFLDDVRITTNVPLHETERAMGTRVSDEVKNHVLDNGETWLDRAFVVDDWYISSYEPILDIDGNRVGMLYAGYLESPYRLALWKALTVLVLMFLGLMFLSSVVSIRGAKSIFRPLESMSRVVQATAHGDESSRIGNIKSSDELGELARGFDHMLDLLQIRNDEVRQWAEHLEDKVSERTAELMQKNEELHQTIRMLRQTRQQLVLAEKLAALGELTAGVAHEINNPTQVILGNLDLLVTQLGETIEPARAEVDLVIQQVYRIQGIINNLLQYARPKEYAGYETGLEEVDVNAVIVDTMQLIQHLHSSRNFELNTILQSDIDIRIDPQELQQVLVNLTVNAVHALPREGGSVLIETRNWDRKGIRITVKDNGDGITRENLKNIFNPFFSTKQQGEGTGLGLSISYGLIRKYGGTITANSRPGEFTEFVIWLLKEPEWTADEETVAEHFHASDSDIEPDDDAKVSENAA
jgi:two-component system NtrC family sensor kinase